MRLFFGTLCLLLLCPFYQVDVSASGMGRISSQQLEDIARDVWAAAWEVPVMGLGASRSHPLNLLTYPNVLDQLTALNQASGESAQGRPSFDSEIDAILGARHALRSVLENSFEAEEVPFATYQLILKYFQGMNVLNQEMNLRLRPGVVPISSQEFLNDMVRLGSEETAEELEQYLKRDAASHLAVYNKISNALFRLCSTPNSERNQAIEAARRQLWAIHNGQIGLKMAIGDGIWDQIESAYHRTLAENFRGLRLLQQESASGSGVPISESEFLMDLKGLGIFTTIGNLENLISTPSTH